ncbi:MAG: tetratricopeptide repeat protein [Deltaproteobacteria bacterium]|nr:tetratricopeptide repeat protein [Deltaproteobacteria bacterium]
MVSSLRPARLTVLLATAWLATSCLEPPGVGRAADPTRAPGPAPWGSATSNAELEKKRALLEDVLDGELTAEGLAARLQKDWPELDTDQRARSLVGVTTVLEDLTKTGRAGKPVAPGPDREMAVAQLYFSERRFIEAATILSRVLDLAPTYPQARNLLARCFFFLGNRDRTIEELEFVLNHPEQQKDRGEVLDALFLLGAAVAETPGMSRENLQKARGAWETYLKIAPADSPSRDHVQKGLVDLEAGLRGEGPLAQPLVPVAAGDDDGATAPTAPLPAAATPPAATSNTARRVEQLPADATPLARAVAEGWDALDARDLATAETKLKAALKQDGKSPEALTGLARVFVQTGRNDEAMTHFDKAIAQAPGYMPALHYRGMAKLMAGDPAGAVASWEQIRTKDPAYFAQFNLEQRVAVARQMSP